MSDAGKLTEQDIDIMNWAIQSLKHTIPYSELDKLAALARIKFKLMILIAEDALSATPKKTQHAKKTATPGADSDKSNPPSGGTRLAKAKARIDPVKAKRALPNSPKKIGFKRAPETQDIDGKSSLKKKPAGSMKAPGDDVMVESEPEEATGSGEDDIIDFNEELRKYAL